MTATDDNEGTSLQKHGSNSDTAYAIGCLGVLGVIGILLYLVFAPLPRARDFYFQFAQQPEIPHGTYGAVSITEDSFQDKPFSPTKHVIRFTGGALTNGAIESQAPAPTALDYISPTLTYSAECEPGFWNLCTALTPGTTYYGRWVDATHETIAIGSLGTGEDGKAFVDPRKTAVYTVTGWAALGK